MTNSPATMRRTLDVTLNGGVRLELVSRDSDEPHKILWLPSHGDRDRTFVLGRSTDATTDHEGNYVEPILVVGRVVSRKHLFIRVGKNGTSAHIKDAGSSHGSLLYKVPTFPGAFMPPLPCTRERWLPVDTGDSFILGREVFRDGRGYQPLGYKIKVYPISKTLADDSLVSSTSRSSVVSLPTSTLSPGVKGPTPLATPTANTPTPTRDTISSSQRNFPIDLTGSTSTTAHRCDDQIVRTITPRSSSNVIRLTDEEVLSDEEKTTLACSGKITQANMPESNVGSMQSDKEPLTSSTDKVSLEGGSNVIPNDGIDSEVVCSSAANSEDGDDARYEPSCSGSDGESESDSDCDSLFDQEDREIPDEEYNQLRSKYDFEERRRVRESILQADAPAVPAFNQVEASEVEEDEGAAYRQLLAEHDAWNQSRQWKLHLFETSLKETKTDKPKWSEPDIVPDDEVYPPSASCYLLGYSTKYDPDYSSKKNVQVPMAAEGSGSQSTEVGVHLTAMANAEADAAGSSETVVEEAAESSETQGHSITSPAGTKRGIDEVDGADEDTTLQDESCTTATITADNSLGEVTITSDSSEVADDGHATVEPLMYTCPTSVIQRARSKLDGLRAVKRPRVSMASPIDPSRVKDVAYGLALGAVGTFIGLAALGSSAQQ